MKQISRHYLKRVVNFCFVIIRAVTFAKSTAEWVDLLNQFNIKFNKNAISCSKKHLQHHIGDFSIHCEFWSNHPGTKPLCLSDWSKMCLWGSICWWNCKNNFFANAIDKVIRPCAWGEANSSCLPYETVNSSLLTAVTTYFVLQTVDEKERFDTFVRRMASKTGIRGKHDKVHGTMLQPCYSTNAECRRRQLFAPHYRPLGLSIGRGRGVISVVNRLVRYWAIWARGQLVLPGNAWMVTINHSINRYWRLIWYPLFFTSECSVRKLFIENPVVEINKEFSQHT